MTLSLRKLPLVPSRSGNVCKRKRRQVNMAISWIELAVILYKTVESTRDGCLMARSFQTLVNRLLTRKTTMFDLILSNIAGHDVCNQKCKGTLSLLCTSPPPPSLTCNHCRIKKQELYPGIPTGEGVTWLIYCIRPSDGLPHPPTAPS